MVIALTRVFFDTNVYIIGAADPNSYESRLLQWVGFGEKEPSSVEVVVSEELFDCMVFRISGISGGDKHPLKSGGVEDLQEMKTSKKKGILYLDLVSAEICDRNWFDGIGGCKSKHASIKVEFPI
jgi:hypothetical protein